MEEENNLPDIPIPLVEVDMVVDDTPLVFPDEPEKDDEKEDKGVEKYMNEMLEDGLTASDMLFFLKQMKGLERVKTMKLHCTSCDKHLGTAPNAKSQRVEHPLLKVLICESCANFYSSGEFLKDQDGSELYCRWCGEGGSVFCCTKCPFVFCKRCITRNIGRTKAGIIQSSAHWMCFACNPCQIDRFRTSFWAVQKYANEMLEKYTEDPSNPILSEDASTCCSAVKRPSDKKKAAKRAKYAHNGNGKRKHKNATADNDRHYDDVVDVGDDDDDDADDADDEDYVPDKWQNFTSGSEAEVICTPDIIPIDDESPVPSPEVVATPPSAKQPVPRPPPLQPAPVLPPNYFMHMTLPPVTPVMPSPPPLTLPCGATAVPPQNLYLATTPANLAVAVPIPTPPPAPVPKRLRPIKSKAELVNQQPVRIVSTKSEAIPGPSNTPSSVSAPQHDDDWFKFALKHCVEITEYISTKVAGLSDFYQRAQTSMTLLGEVHETLQSYMSVIINKLTTMKSLTKQKFHENLIELKKKIPVDPVKIALRRKKAKKYSNEKDNVNLTLDLEVTNESDESDSDTSSWSYSSESIHPHLDTSVITVEDSDDDSPGCSDTNFTEFIKNMKSLLENLDSKVIVDMSDDELVKFLTAIVVIKNTVTNHKIYGNISQKESKREDIATMLLNTTKKNMSLATSTLRVMTPDSTVDLNTLKELNKTLESSCEINSECEVSNGTQETPMESSQEEKQIENVPSSQNEPENISSSGRTTPEKLKQVPLSNSVDKEELNSSSETTSKEAEDSPNKVTNDATTSDNEFIEPSTCLPIPDEVEEKMDEHCDIEDVISCSVITRKKKPVQQFDDSIDPTVLFLSDIGSDRIDRHQINIARALDLIPDDVNDIIDKDNGSLSLPPDSTDFCMDDIVRDLKLVSEKDDPENISLFANSHDQKSNSTEPKNESANNSSIEDILELRQIAEQCVK